MGISAAVLIHQAVGALLLPPMTFIWLALFGLWRRRRAPVLVALGLAYLLATPQMAYWLVRPLQPSVPSPAALQAVDAIAVLGGGKSLSPEFGDEELGADSLIRLRYAAWLAREIRKPILVTGGAPEGGEPEAAIMARTLARDYGLKAKWIEGASNTTAENAALSAPLLRAAGVKRMALVSDGWHLRRASGLFQRQGFEVLAAPTGLVLGHTQDDSALRPWLPNGGAMRLCWTALHEWLGIGWQLLGGLSE